MADYINDKELEELNEIYEQKRQNQKHPKKVKPEKAPKPEKAQKPDKPNKSDKPKPQDAPADKEKRLNRAHIISVVVSAALLFVTAIALVVIPRPTESALEKRKLAAFPEFSWDKYWSGEYTEEISEFYNDTVPLRDSFKELGAAFRSLFGISFGNEQIVGSVGDTSIGDETKVTTASTKPIVIVTPPPKDDSSPDVSSDVETPAPSETDTPDKSTAPDETTPPDETTAPDETTTPAETTVPAETTTPAPDFHTPSDPDAEVLMQEGFNIVYNSNGVLHAGMLYSGNRENAQYFAATVDGLRRRINADLYFMPILTQNTFVTPSELNRGVYTELTDSQYLINVLGDRAKIIDTYKTLAAHADEDIYFLRDVHWQQLGAYYAMSDFAKAAGVEYPPLDSYTCRTRDCLGSTYTFTQFDALAGAYEDFTYYIPSNEFTVEYYDENYENPFEYPLMPENDYRANGFYSLFMVAENYIKHITTDADTDRTLVILADDYISAAVPCLTSSFKEIYVIDVRHCTFNVADFINEHGATDVLLAMTVSNALGDVGSYLDYLQ